MAATILNTVFESIKSKSHDGYNKIVDKLLP